MCYPMPYKLRMIRTFRNKGLSELWSNDRTAKIHRRMHERILERLDALDAAGAPDDLDVSGYDFHALRGFSPVRYTVHVNGPWCMTFEFLDGDAYRIDFEQYH